MRNLTLLSFSVLSLSVSLSLGACTQRGETSAPPATAAPVVAAPTPAPAAPVAAAPAAPAPAALPATAVVANPLPAGAAAAPVPATAKGFGAALTGAAPLSLAKVLTAPENYGGKDVVVDGKVRANCTKKGCWMEIASAMDKDAPGCRVTFKDYGFFVPLNSQGSDARVEGHLDVKTIPAAEVAHLEGEGGRFPNKAPDGSAKEVRIVANGVALWRAN